MRGTPWLVAVAEAFIGQDESWSRDCRLVSHGLETFQGRDAGSHAQKQPKYCLYAPVMRPSARSRVT